MSESNFGSQRGGNYLKSDDQGTDESDRNYEPFDLATPFRQLLSRNSPIVLDVSALPALPRILDETDLQVLVPRVFFQLLSVHKDDVPTATIPGVSEERSQQWLQSLANDTLIHWVSRRGTISWQQIRNSLHSPRCQPVWKKGVLDQQAQVALEVPSISPVEVPINGIESDDLVGLTLAQEITAAAEEDVPIIGSDYRPIVKLACKFLSTLVVGGPNGPNELIDRKKTYFEEVLRGIPNRTRGVRWFVGAMLGVGGLIPVLGVPLGLGGLALLIVDP